MYLVDLKVCKKKLQTFSEIGHRCQVRLRSKLKIDHVTNLNNFSEPKLGPRYPKFVLNVLHTYKQHTNHGSR